MSLEQSIQDLITASGQQTEAANQLNQTVAEKITDIDGRVEQKRIELDQFMASARQEFGHLCFTPNQVMAPNVDNTGVEGLNHIFMTLDVQVEAALVAGSSHTNGWPNAAGQEFADSIDMDYTNAAFNILRIAWSNAGISGTPRFHNSFHSGQHQGSFTEAAYIKLISGTLGGDFSVHKEFENDWKLMGRKSADPFYANHSGLMLTSTSGEMLIALYGKATGHADLANGAWGRFPSII